MFHDLLKIQTKSIEKIHYKTRYHIFLHTSVKSIKILINQTQASIKTLLHVLRDLHHKRKST